MCWIVNELRSVVHKESHKNSPKFTVMSLMITFCFMGRPESEKIQQQQQSSDEGICSYAP